MLIILPLGEVCGFTVGHPVGLRAVQVCTWTPETWLLGCWLEIILHTLRSEQAGSREVK